MRARDERLHGDYDKDGQREGQQEPIFRRDTLTPCAPDDKKQAGKQNWPEYAELRSQEFQTLARIDQRTLPIGIVGGVRQGGELVGAVPNDVGRNESGANE